MQYHNKFSNFTVLYSYSCYMLYKGSSVLCGQKRQANIYFFPACKSADLRRAGQ